MKGKKRRHVPDSPSLRVVIISGLSGAGKTVALRSLEDSGYFCIDNLPITLIEAFLTTIGCRDNIKKIGIGVDIREKSFLTDVYHILTSLKTRHKIEILFFEAGNEVLIRRYKETRRPHPMLSFYGETNLNDAIEEEREILSIIRDSADKIIDTSNYTPHQLRYLIMTSYGGIETGRGINLCIISFGYKFGAPQNLDLLFDIRFLPNPHFIPELRALKGTDTAVSDFVLKNDEAGEFLSHLTRFLDFLIPLYTKEGRAYLTIGIGCTGGVHRSPAVVEGISRYISEKHSIKPNVIHRDMG